MDNAKIAVAFIGGGWVSCNRHMPAVGSVEAFNPIGLISTQATLESIDRENLTKKFGLKHYSNDLNVTWLAEIDAVVIGTPPETHYKLVMNCLRMGKHVLVEKPFAMNSVEAREMVDLAKKSNLTLAVCHNFQFADSTLRARQILENGQLGELEGVFGFQCSNHERRLPKWYKELPLGLFTDESPHLLYLLRSFMGQSQQTSIYTSNPISTQDNTPRVVSTHFVATNGVIGSLYMTFISALSEWQLTLFGSKATAVIDIFRDILVTFPNDGRHESLGVLRTTLSGVGNHLLGVASSGPKHILGTLNYGNNEVFKRFASAIQTGTTPQGIDATDGLAVVEMMERINQAAPHYGGQK